MSFGTDLTLFTKKLGVKSNKFLRNVAVSGLKRVVEKTPVDTKRAHLSWQVGLGAVERRVADERRNTPERHAPMPFNQGDFQIQLFRARSAKIGNSVFISNSLDYAPGLERGTSRQSQAMITRTIAELKANIDSGRLK